MSATRRPATATFVLVSLASAAILPGCSYKYSRDPGQGYYPTYSRGVIDAKALDRLKTARASLEDVLLSLGEPDESSTGILTYRWVMAIETHRVNFLPMDLGIPMAISWEVNTVSVFLDASGRVERWNLTKSDGGTR